MNDFINLVSMTEGIKEETSHANNPTQNHTRTYPSDSGYSTGSFLAEHSMRPRQSNRHSNFIQTGRNSTRAIFSETIYDLIRWWRPLWYIIDKEPSANQVDLEKLLTIYLFTKKGRSVCTPEQKRIRHPAVLPADTNHEALTSSA